MPALLRDHIDVTLANGIDDLLELFALETPEVRRVFDLIQQRHPDPLLPEIFELPK